MKTPACILFSVALQVAAVSVSSQEPKSHGRLSGRGEINSVAIQSNHNRNCTFSDGCERADANGVAIQSDGKIIAVGVRDREAGGINRRDFAVARYNTDGSLDTGFSDDGRQLTDFGGNDEANAVAVQPDGKIVVVGGTSGGTQAGGGDIAVARYNTDGSLDTDFSDDGRQITDLGMGKYDEARDIAIQPDGKIVVAATKSLTPTGFAFILVRYNKNGSLDTTFTGPGKPTEIAQAEARRVAIQTDGKILGLANSLLCRFNQDGNLDSSFGKGGKVIINPQRFDPRALAVYSNGKIIVSVGSSSSFALACYNTDGSLDTSFLMSGKLAGGVAGIEGKAYAVAIQADGRIIAAGFAPNPSIAYNVGFALARYDRSGNPDPTFSDDGLAIVDFGMTGKAAAVAIQSDGKIIAAGGNGFIREFVLARLDKDGRLDNTFGNSGKVITNFEENKD